MKKKINTDPWQHMVIDDFLSKERWEEIKRMAHYELMAYQRNPKLTPSGKWIRWCDTDILPEANVVHKMMPKFRDVEYLYSGYPSSVKKIMHWAVCPPNYVMPMHCDYDARFFTNVLYISPDETYGTILCENDSEYDDYHRLNTTLESNKREVEVEWKPNRLFAFNNMDKAWHYYKSGNHPRIVLQSFFVDLNKILPNKDEWDHLIDLDGKYYF